ncbi:hypothetical protein GN956_G181 [Arapaima gigas]
MSMRSTVFAGAGYKLDAAGKKDADRPRREPGDALPDVPRKASQSPGTKAALALIVGGHGKVGTAPGLEENVAAAGTALGKPVGGEGTVARSRSVLGHGNSADRTDRDGADKGLAPLGLCSAAVAADVSTEGKWRSARKSPGHWPAQATCLRQIVLLQLDLIEQQQQQLQAKDKEIEELKADKDTLLARIERMERRLQLGKKDSRDKRLFQPLEPWTPDREDFLEVETAESPPVHTPKNIPFGRNGKGHKRKFCFLDTKTPKSRGKSKFSPHKLETDGGSPFQRELRSKETPEKTGMGRQPLQGDAAPVAKELPKSSAQMEDLPYMSTTEMYLCRWHQPPPSPLREPSPKKEEVVAIPSWRENNMEPLEKEVAFDLPENLDDSVFLKRHAKLELDEKRRKRWDIQRIREQRMFQRLQQRMNKKKGFQESEPEVSSFYPDIEDVESLLITPFLPVVAFGRPLPKLTQQNFELPWLDERSRCRIEMQKKQTPHRNCRK